MIPHVAQSNASGGRGLSPNLFSKERELLKPFVVLMAATFALAASACMAVTTGTPEIAVDPIATAAATSNSAEFANPTPEMAAKLNSNSQPLHVNKFEMTSATREQAELQRAINTTAVVVLATWKGGEFTNQDLSSTLQLRKPRDVAEMKPEEIMALPAARLRKVVADLIYEQAIADKARTIGIDENTSEIKKVLEDYRAVLLNKLFYERNVQPRLARMDEKTAHDFYEQEKDRLYALPQVFALKVFHLSRYKPYEVKTSDTLESIAREQSGDPKAVFRILEDDPIHHPRAPEREHADTIPIVEVTSGEKLLVPINRDEETSKRSFAQTIQKRLAAGESFDPIASQYSEAERSVRLQAFTPDFDDMVPAVKDAIGKLGDTSVTQVVETPHGFDIFVAAVRETTRTMSYDEVKDKVLAGLTDDQKRKSATEVKKEIFDQLRDKHKVVINTEALKRADYGGADPLTGNTPIATAPGLNYTLDQFLHDLLPTMKSWSGMKYEDRLDVVKASPTVNRYIIAREAEVSGLDNLDEFKRQMKSKATLEITSEYLRRNPTQKSQPTEADFREYYNSHLDRYTSPPMVTLREITKRVNLGLPPGKKSEAIENAKKLLSGLKASLHSQSDFEEAARRESESIATRSRGGLIGTVSNDFRGDMFKNQIAQLKPGDVSEPFLYGGEVMIVRLDAETKSLVIPFQEALPRVRANYYREVPAQQERDEREKVLTEAQFQLKF